MFRTRDEAERCMAICRACPGGWFCSDSERCLHPRCGCFSALKTRLATEGCPEGYWPPAEGVETGAK